MRPMAAAAHLASNALLARLARPDVDLLAPYLKTSELPKGQVLQEVETTVEHVWFPLSGMVSLVVVKPDGSLVETGVVGREGAVNAMIGTGPWKSFSRAIVQLAGAGMTISMARFQEAARESENIRSVMSRYREFLLDQIQQTAACNALHSLDTRLARWLLEGQDRTQDNRISLTQEFLSEMLGVRRTSVTSTTAKLQARGLIQQRRGEIIIRDLEGLQKAACDCYATLRRHSAEIFPD